MVSTGDQKNRNLNKIVYSKLKTSKMVFENTTQSDKISYSKLNRTPNFYFDMFVNRDLIKLHTANKQKQFLFELKANGVRIP